MQYVYVICICIKAYKHLLFIVKYYYSEEHVYFNLKTLLTEIVFFSPFSFNRIDVPPYENYDKFYEKLTCAVEETCGFAVE